MLNNNINYTEEHGYLIDYDTKWFARLHAAPHTEKYGWRVFCKDGTLAGILDEDKLAVWYVDEDTLRQDNNEYTKLADTDITVKTYNILARNGIINVEDLAKISSEEIIKWTNLGRRSFEEVLQLMKKHNVSFADE